MTERRPDQPVQPEAPTTEAGRTLLGAQGDALWLSLNRRTMSDYILAIEAEAALRVAVASGASSQERPQPPCDRCGDPVEQHRQAGEDGRCKRYGCDCRRTQWFLRKEAAKRVAQERPVDAHAIDVERLAQAIDSVVWDSQGRMIEIARREAKRIADEYARPSAQDSE